MPRQQHIDICGFLVVRTPDNNYLPEDSQRRTGPVPKFGDIAYGGLERLPWHDVDTDYYEGTLPEDISLLRKRINSAYTVAGCMDLCDRLEDALQFLQFTNRKGDANEIIAVYSEGLAELKGSQGIEASSLQFLGFDITMMEWSILRAGLFGCPSQFEEWHSFVNSNGLLSSREVFDDYVERYNTAARAGHVEELHEVLFRVEVVEIFRVT